MAIQSDLHLHCFGVGPENRSETDLPTGDTAITACYRRGMPQMDTSELGMRPESHTAPDSSYP